MADRLDQILAQIRNRRNAPPARTLDDILGPEITAENYDTWESPDAELNDRISGMRDRRPGGQSAGEIMGADAKGVGSAFMDVLNYRPIEHGLSKLPQGVQDSLQHTLRMQGAAMGSPMPSLIPKLDVGTIGGLASGGVAMGARAAMPAVARGAQIADAAFAIPYGVQGGATALDSDRSSGERGMGVVQALIAGLAAKMGMSGGPGKAVATGRPAGLDDAVTNWRGQPGFADTPPTPPPGPGGSYGGRGSAMERAATEAGIPPPEGTLSTGLPRTTQPPMATRGPDALRPGIDGPMPEGVVTPQGMPPRRPPVGGNPIMERILGGSYGRQVGEAGADLPSMRGDVTDALDIEGLARPQHLPGVDALDLPNAAGPAPTNLLEELLGVPMRRADDLGVPGARQPVPDPGATGGPRTRRSAGLEPPDAPPVAPGTPELPPSPTVGRMTAQQLLDKIMGQGPQPAAPRLASDLAPDQAGHMRAIREELDEFPFQKGQSASDLNELPGAERLTGPYAENTGLLQHSAGAPVFHDIMGGTKGTRSAVTRALGRYLGDEGARPTALSQRSLGVAQRRALGDPDVSQSLLPNAPESVPAPGLGRRGPLGGLDEAIDTVPSSSAPAAAAGDIHPAIRELHEELTPKWQATAAEQAGDGVPFTVDPTEDLASFAERIRTADRSSLWSKERKIRDMLDAGGGDAGFANFAGQEVLGGVAGGIGAGATGDSIEDKITRAVMGATVGAGGMHLLSRGLDAMPASAGASRPRGTSEFIGDMDTVEPSLRQLERQVGGQPLRSTETDRFDLGRLAGDETGAVNMRRYPTDGPKKPQANEAPALPGDPYRFAAMLSGPVTHAKNVLGGMGAATTKTLENVLQGNFKRAADIPRNLLSREALRDAKAAFKDPGMAGADVERWGSAGTNVIGRLLIAPDYAVRRALQRAGLTLEEARHTAFTGPPNSDAGKKFVDFINSVPASKLLVPFPRIATNLMETGIEHTPGLGSLAQKLSGGNLKSNLAKQIIGGAAGAGVVASGGLPEPYSVKGQVARAALGPLALPADMIDTFAGELSEAESVGDGLSRVPGALYESADAALEGAPFMIKPWQWKNIPGQYIPQFLKQLGKVTGAPQKDEFDTTGNPLAALLAQVPWLNEAVLTRKDQGKRPQRTERTQREKR